jgi:hypothetical protein
MASSAGNAGVRQPLWMFDHGRHHIHCSEFILGRMLPRGAVSTQITPKKENEKKAFSMSSQSVKLLKRTSSLGHI